MLFCRDSAESYISPLARIYTPTCWLCFSSIYFTHSSPCCWWCYDFPTFVSPIHSLLLFFSLYAMPSDRHDRLRYTLYTHEIHVAHFFTSPSPRSFFLLFLSRAVFCESLAASSNIVPKSRSSLLIAIDLNSPIYAEWMLNARKRFAQRRIEHIFFLLSSIAIYHPSKLYSLMSLYGRQ